MKTKSRHFIMLVIIGLITTSCSKNINNQNSFEINKNWVFKSINDSLWDKAEVPGCIHTDLIANGKIDDPFYRMNEHDIQWIDKKDWEYKTTFLVDENTLNKDEVEITFHGLDTYANVYLNDSLILKADNMFIKWNVKCKQDLKKGENSLRIVFESPIKIGLEKRDSLDFVFPDPPNDFSQIGGLGDKKVSLFSRKAGYHFGWDWGPRLVSSGIWDKIEIAAWNKARLTDVNIIQHELNNNNAKLSSNIEIESIAKSEVTVTGYLDSENIFEKVFPIKEGNNHFKIPFSISKPELWWTNGLGDQKLYNIVVEIKDSSGLLSSKNLNIGLRTLEVIQEPDSIGKSFYFKLNGHPVFMKGANYIPQDVFLNRVNQDEYERVIQSAVDANYNMLRVWGGGIYERDIFYDLCDKFGILVWQDFMFACSMYPGDDKFLESVKIEATQNVKRLRNHPSIAIWCGDNENLSAWNNWGWKDQIFEKYGQGVVDKIWKAYDDIFHSILPNVVNDLDPQRLYWSSSPSAGFGQVENGKSGDMHYWGVWWGKEPFSKYNEIIPRFMSEFGFQSFPQFESIKKFSRKEDWDINSEVMKSHQRSSIGNVTIEEYLLRDYRKPKDFEKFLYVGQLLQAEGIKLGIHAHRQNMPYCMGSLYWQINDCWPVASWSSTDYYGNWKALHYRVRDAFKDIILSTKTSNDDLNIYVISDKLKNIDAKISLELINFDGQILNSWENKIIVEANKSKVYLSESIDSITLGKNLEETLLRIKLISSSQNILDSYNHYFVKPKNLNIPKSNVDVKIKKLRNQNFSIVLSSDKLAKNVYLSSSITGFFSDNYIDIFPDEILEINFQTNDKISIDSLKNDLKVISLIDTY